MTAQSTAQGIASLGRYGDDLIVHMNQEEVQGLQALAKKHGTSLTINPDTGMPEAFKLGKVFKAVLPIAAGFALGPGGFASGMFEAGSFMGSALGTGLLVGGATAALTGNLGQGLMAGLGAYGGFGLSDVYSKMGGMSGIMGAGKSTASLNAELLGKQGINTVGNSIVPVSKVPQVGNIGAAMEANVNNLASAFPKTPVAGGGLGTVGGPGINLNSLQSLNTPISSGTNVLSNLTPTAATTIGTSPNIPLSLADTSKSALYRPGLAENFAAAGGKASQLYMPIGQAALAGVEPSDFYEDPITPQEKQSYEQTGVDSMGRPTYGYTKASAYNPYRTLNLGGPSPLNLGASTKSYATGGTIQSGGIRDLYGTPDNQPTISPGLSGFGLGRLNNLAGEQAMTQAQTLGYARGGYLDGQGDGMSDSIPATIEGKQPARLADGEFVVPADVVSHLGNGSSKAGSKRLYAMMQKVRKARTGNPRQGKQINPARYMPA
jgi:hypothetical protein